MYLKRLCGCPLEYTMILDLFQYTVASTGTVPGIGGTLEKRFCFAADTVRGGTTLMRIVFDDWT